MQVDTRYTSDATGKKQLRGLVLISQSELESKMLDDLFGKKVDDDGLIGIRTVECRLSDGYSTHYLYIKAEDAGRRNTTLQEEKSQRQV